MTIDNYTPATALSSYYQTRETNRPARHWATEKLIHDLAGIGMLSFFEGPGPNPMVLTGADEGKLWLDTDAGVTTSSGTFKAYAGTGTSTDEANWVTVNPARYLLHIGALSPVSTVADYATRTAASAATIASGTTYLRTAGYSSVGDGGAVLYQKVGAEPSHAGKFQSVDGAWWELAEEQISVKMFGAAGDGSTNDATAFQNAINYIEGLSTRGGTIYVPRGKYALNSGLTITGDGIEIVGEGVADIWLPSGWAAAPTDLNFNHTTGAAIRVKANSVRLRNFRVSSGATRAAAAAGSNYGIQLENDDTSGGTERVNGCSLENLHVIQQPNHGIALIGNCVSNEFQMCTVTACGGHGFIIDQGDATGRTNKARPGIVNITNCRANDNTGHGISVGTPVSSIELPYRVDLHNFEGYRNALSGSVRYTSHDSYIFGENVLVRLSAFAGYDGSGTSNVGGGVFVAGRNIRLDTVRLVSTSVPLTIGTEAGLSTNGVYVLNPTISGGTTRPVAVQFETGISDVSVDIAYVAGFTDWSTTEANVSGLFARVGTSERYTGLRNGAQVTIADDAATSIEFTGAARGILLLSSNASSAKAAIVHFRVGASAFCTVYGMGYADVTGTTGALAGTTGTDTNLTISAHTDNRLYIENRTGASRVYTLNFMCLEGAHIA